MKAELQKESVVTAATGAGDNNFSGGIAHAAKEAEDKRKALGSQILTDKHSTATTALTRSKDHLLQEQFSEKLL